MSIFDQCYVLPISVGGLDIVLPVPLALPLVLALSPPSQSCSTSETEGGRMEDQNTEVINGTRITNRRGTLQTNTHESKLQRVYCMRYQHDDEQSWLEI